MTADPDIQLRCKNRGYRVDTSREGLYVSKYLYQCIKSLILVYKIIMTYQFGFEKESKSNCTFIKNKIGKN